MIYHRIGSDPPPELLRTLDSRGVAAQACTDPFTALSELLIARRTPGLGLVILLIEPEQLDQVDRLSRALLRYAPWATCWVYREQDQPHLQSIDPAELGITGPQPNGLMPPAGDHVRTAPHLRLTGDGPADDAHSRANLPHDAREELDGDEADGSPDAEGPASLLTEEELRMLLADDADEGDRA